MTCTQNRSYRPVKSELNTAIKKKETVPETSLSLRPKKDGIENENSAEQKGILTEVEINSCISVLEYLLQNGDQIIQLSEEQRLKLMKAAGQITRPDKAEIYKRNKSVKVARRQGEIADNRKARAATSIRSARTVSVFEAPSQIALPASDAAREKHFLNSEQNCYVCKKPYTEIHHFYDSMCKACGDLNYAKRFQTCDMTGQVALITGSRLKIGYHATLMMLRSGATIIATTRFPADSAIRFAKEKDFSVWSHRLHIYGLDLRHIPSVELLSLIHI